MKTVLNNHLIHYIDIGISTAAPIVFLHGFPFSHKMWMFPGGQTEALATTYRLIAYDHCGHGESEVGDAQYTMEFFVDDLFGLLDHLNVKSAVLVGMSMGGYIALRAMERNPDRFRALILANTRSEADTNEIKIRRAGNIKAIKQNGPKVFAEGYIETVFWQNSINNKMEAVKTIQSIVERTAPVSLCGTLLALAGRTDTTSSLSKIKIPTLIMTGEHDILTPHGAARAMRDRISGAELKIIPRSGHMSNMENPDEFNKHLVDFLGRALKPSVAAPEPAAEKTAAPAANPAVNKPIIQNPAP